MPFPINLYLRSIYLSNLNMFYIVFNPFPFSAIWWNEELILSLQKSGHWCAAHVRTAWAIHVRQQYQKQQEAAVRSSSDQFHASAKLPTLPLLSQLYTQTTSRAGGPSSVRDQSDLRPPGINLNADGKWIVQRDELTFFLPTIGLVKRLNATTCLKELRLTYIDGPMYSCGFASWLIYTR